MTADQATAIRVEAGRRSGWIFGSGRTVVPALKVVRCPRQWDDKRRAWMVPIAHLSDAIAAIEMQFGGEITLIEVDR